MFLSRLCAGCGLGRSAPRRLFCGRCEAVVHPVGPIAGLAGLDSTGALYHYDGSVRRAIVAAKTGARPDVFRTAGRELADLAVTLDNLAVTLDNLAVTLGNRPDRFALVTWVPASRRGRAERGFDQGRIMAGVLGKQLKIPTRRVFSSGRSSQLGLGRADRLAADGFRARGAVSGSVLLIDDVITTGASMSSAANALRSAGAQSVTGVAVAWAASVEELAAGRPLSGARKSGPFAPARLPAPG